MYSSHASSLASTVPVGSSQLKPVWSRRDFTIAYCLLKTAYLFFSCSLSHLRPVFLQNSSEIYFQAFFPKVLFCRFPFLTCSTIKSASILVRDVVHFALDCCSCCCCRCCCCCWDGALLDRITRLAICERNTSMRLRNMDTHNYMSEKLLCRTSW